MIGLYKKLWESIFDDEEEIIGDGLDAMIEDKLSVDGPFWTSTNWKYGSHTDEYLKGIKYSKGVLDLTGSGVGEYRDWDSDAIAPNVYFKQNGWKLDVIKATEIQIRGKYNSAYKELSRASNYEILWEDYCNDHFECGTFACKGNPVSGARVIIDPSLKKINTASVFSHSWVTRYRARVSLGPGLSDMSADYTDCEITFRGVSPGECGMELLNPRDLSGLKSNVGFLNITFYNGPWKNFNDAFFDKAYRCEYSNQDPTRAGDFDQLAKTIDLKKYMRRLNWPFKVNDGFNLINYLNIKKMPNLNYIEVSYLSTKYHNHVMLSFFKDDATLKSLLQSTLAKPVLPWELNIENKKHKILTADDCPDVGSGWKVMLFVRN